MELVLHTYADGSQEWVGKERIAEIKRNEIVSLKSELASLDYKAIKYAEGLISNEDYSPIKEYRQSLRDRINKLEKELNNGNERTENQEV